MDIMLLACDRLSPMPLVRISFDEIVSLMFVLVTNNWSRVAIAFTMELAHLAPTGERLQNLGLIQEGGMCAVIDLPGKAFPNPATRGLMGAHPRIVL